MEYITKEYTELLKQLHNTKKAFGAGKPNIFLLDGRHIEILKKAKRVLDYGCGKGSFVRYVQENLPDVEIVGYDPAVEEYSKLPEGHFDFIWCTDVLEHIEPELIDNIINHLKELSTDYLYVSANCTKAKKHLADGRNAHLIIQPKEWWNEKLISIGTILKEEVTISRYGKEKELKSINYHTIIKK